MSVCYFIGNLDLKQNSKAKLTQLKCQLFTEIKLYYRMQRHRFQERFDSEDVLAGAGLPGVSKIRAKQQRFLYDSGTSKKSWRRIKTPFCRLGNPGFQPGKMTELYAVSHSIGIFLSEL
jgi:hypothetical protein